MFIEIKEKPIFHEKQKKNPSSSVLKKFIQELVVQFLSYFKSYKAWLFSRLMCEFVENKAKFYLLPAYISDTQGFLQNSNEREFKSMVCNFLHIPPICQKYLCRHLRLTSVKNIPIYIWVDPRFYFLVASTQA